jgi:hypothetical protein
MMNTTMNRQKHQTVRADLHRVMLSLQLNNLILRLNLKPKTASHSQNRHKPRLSSSLNPPLSIEDEESFMNDENEFLSPF